LCRLAEEIWSQGPRILHLVHLASPAQQAALASSLQSAVLYCITQLSSASAVTMEGAGQEADLSAAVTHLANLVLLALSGCCGTERPARQQFLQPLLLGSGAGSADYGTAASGTSPVGQQYSLAQAQFLVALGEEVGFGLLLGLPSSKSHTGSQHASEDGAACSAAASVVVGVLAALAQGLGPSEQAAALEEPLATYLILQAASGRPSLLAACLEAALRAAVREAEQQQDEPSGSSSGGDGSSGGARAAASSSAGLAVLRHLLGAAARAGSPAAQAAAAVFFQGHIAGAAGAAVPLPILTEVLQVVATPFRADQQLLERSALPALAVRLCEGCSSEGAGPEREQLLAAVVRCVCQPSLHVPCA
jgi:hypothetical protein